MRRLILPLFFGILGTAILVTLGTWQVQRLAWKNALLAEIDARIVDVPVALPLAPTADEDRYLPVHMSGLITEQEAHVLSSARDVGPIYRVVAAFETREGRRVLLDRGWIATAAKNDPRKSVSAEIIGNLQWPRERDSYTPANDLNTNIWFARDVEALAEALHTEPVLVVLRKTSETELVVTPFPVNGAAFPNDHLQYAVTWFGLAIVWVMMTLYYLFRMRKPKKGLML